MRLRIIRPAGGGSYESGGASTAQPISTTQALQVFPTRLPIRTGDHIGLDQGNGSSLDASIRRVVTGATYPNFNPRLPDSGAFTPFVGPSGVDAELVLNADIEADADKDGFGDETQDQCPTDASTQGPCPPPATPQCSDGVDNDADGAVDSKDPGCLSGANSSYNPADGNESDETLRDLVLCGVREISLLRANLRGQKVILSGFVSASMAGRPVTILANYGGAQGSALKKVATATPNSAGEFTAKVKRPPRKLFKKARFQARVDTFRSRRLKLPQGLASTSIDLSGGEIELGGKVKKSLLGDRKPVVIKRLVCGLTQVAGSAKPKPNGAYRVRFDAPAPAAAALYRAEARVLRKPGGTKYVKRFAHPIGITLAG